MPFPGDPPLPNDAPPSPTADQLLEFLEADHGRLMECFRLVDVGLAADLRGAIILMAEEDGHAW